MDTGEIETMKSVNDGLRDVPMRKGEVGVALDSIFRALENVSDRVWVNAMIVDKMDSLVIHIFFKGGVK